MSDVDQPERFVDDRRRYRLDSRIATGGMGEVWRATDTTLGREVAVKVLKAEYADDPTFRQRFATEGRHAASLHHQGIAAVYDVGEAHGAGVDDGSGVPRPFLVMELVDGEPLSTLLKQGRDAGQTLDRDAVRDLMAQAGDALGVAHAAGIVHRDVKPANLLITPEGRLKVTDFGIARAGDAAGITQTGTVMGTPQYLSPEQAQGQLATARSDVYSLGVVAFECLAGQRPFDAESPVATALAHIREPVPPLPDDVPGDLAAVVQRALAKDPADRYGDGSEFATALRDPATAVLTMPPMVGGAAVTDDEATRVLAHGAPPPGDTGAGAAVADEEERKPKPWLPILVGLLALALLALLAYALLAGRDDEPEEEPTPTPTPTASPTETPEPTPSPTPDNTVQVDESQYVGRPVDEVERDLANLGLRVRREEVDNPGGEPAGYVTAVRPSGTLTRGDTVTVRYWGPQPSPTPTEQPSPTEEPTPTEDPTEGLEVP